MLFYRSEHVQDRWRVSSLRYKYIILMRIKYTAISQKICTCTYLLPPTQLSFTPLKPLQLLSSFPSLRWVRTWKQEESISIIISLLVLYTPLSLQLWTLPPTHTQLTPINSLHFIHPPVLSFDLIVFLWGALNRKCHSIPFLSQNSILHWACSRDRCPCPHPSYTH